jgi:hypothetical protein
VQGRISIAASFADIDNDGDQDVSVMNVRGGNLLFLRTTGTAFFTTLRHKPASAWLRFLGQRLLDYHNHGLVDLLACNVGKYTSDLKGNHGYAGVAGALSGHMYPSTKEISRRHCGNGVETARVVRRCQLVC